MTIDNTIIHQETTETAEETPLKALFRKGNKQSRAESISALWRFLRLPEGQTMELAAFDSDKWKPENEKWSALRGHCLAYASSAEDADARARDKGIYCTGYYIRAAIVAPDALAKHTRGIWHPTREDDTAGEKDVERAIVQVIDIDPHRPDGTSRPKGVNATDAAMSAAHDMALEITEYLHLLGVESASLAHGLSGNGCQLLLALDHIPWSPEIKDLRERFLRALDAKFSVSSHKVDCTLYDGARLIPLFGTWKKKGPSVDDRLQRRTWLLAPEVVQALDFDQFRDLVLAVERDLTPAEKTKMEERKHKGGKPVVKAAKSTKPWTGENKLDECSAVDIDQVATALGCAGKDWVCPKCNKPYHKPRVPGSNLYNCFHDTCGGAEYNSAQLVAWSIGVGDLTGNGEGVLRVIDWFVSNNFVTPPEPKKRGRKRKDVPDAELARLAADPRPVDCEFIQTDEDTALLRALSQGLDITEVVQGSGPLAEARETAAAGAADDDDVLARNPSDLGNSLRLLDRHGSNLRYVPDRKVWLVWSYDRWQEDASGTRLGALCEDTVTSIYQEARAATGEARAALVAWAQRSESVKHIEAMGKLAKNKAELHVTGEKLDVGHHLLCVPGGYVDLRSGQPHDPDRSLLMTRRAAVEYNRDADTTLVDGFLEKVQPDPEVRKYLWRLLGYSLTGEWTEHIFPIHFGSGANGKSTLLDSVAAIMGDYAGLVPDGLLTGDKQQHPAALMTLRGVRFTQLSETERGDRLNTALLKKLTGSRQSTARLMNENFSKWGHTHKIHLDTNFKPRIHDATDGIWRRVHLIPWGVKIEESQRDAKLTDKLGRDPGLLRRLVEGAGAYYREGLNPPASILAATQEYRADSDDFGAFAKECLEPDSESIVELTTIYDAYREWINGRGGKPVGYTNFCAELRRLKLGEPGQHPRSRRAALKCLFRRT